MFATYLFLSAIIIGYLVGSICSAVIVCRIFDLPDPRLQGSKNPGATNVLRLAGKEYAAIVLLADMLKGFLPVLLAKALDAGPIILGFTCLATVIGHMYPIYFKFKGGKGVATAIGALLGFHFMLGVLVIVTWLIIAKITRYASVASITSMVLAPFYSLYAVGNENAFLPLAIITLFVLYKHRENITRLQDGKESKIDFGNKALKQIEDTNIQPLVKPTKVKKATVTKTTKKTPAEKPAKPKNTVKAAEKPKKTAAAKPTKAKKAPPKKKPAVAKK